MGGSVLHDFIMHMVQNIVRIRNLCRGSFRLTFRPNGTRTTNLETVRCISADFGTLKNIRACPGNLIPGLIEFQMDHNGQNGEG